MWTVSSTTLLLLIAGISDLAVGLMYREVNNHSVKCMLCNLI